MEQKVFQKVHPREYLKRFLDNGIRPDGRTFTQSRKITIKVGTVGTAVGSAMLQFGRTTVAAGVHATLCEPAVGAPDQGMFTVNVELLSLAKYKSGRTSDDAASLTEYVRSLLSPHLDLSKLCIEPASLVWRLQLYVYCIDNDGNLEDSVLLAAVAALRNVMLPTVQMIEDEEVDISGLDISADDHEIEEQNDPVIATASAERTNRLEFDSFPLPVSFVLFDGKVLIDPSAEEESVCDSRLTFLFRPSGELRGALKPGGRNLSDEAFKASLEHAKQRVSILHEKLTST